MARLGGGPKRSRRATKRSRSYQPCGGFGEAPSPLLYGASYSLRTASVNARSRPAVVRFDASWSRANSVRTSPAKIPCARACPGHPRLGPIADARNEDVGTRHRAGHGLLIVASEHAATMRPLNRIARAVAGCRRGDLSAVSTVCVASWCDRRGIGGWSMLSRGRCLRIIARLRKKSESSLGRCASATAANSCSIWPNGSIAWRRASKSGFRLRNRRPIRSGPAPVGMADTGRKRIDRAGRRP